MTFHWNTKNVMKLLEDNVPYPVVVESQGAGGDWDSEEILIYPKHVKQSPRDFLKAIRLQAWMESLNSPCVDDAQRSDFDGYEYMSIYDGLSNCGGAIQSDDPDIIQMYADVLKIIKKHMPEVHIIGHYKEIY